MTDKPEMQGGLLVDKSIGRITDTLLSFSLQEWTGFLDHFLFQRMNDERFIQLEQEILKVTDDPEMVFRMFFHIAAGDSKGTSLDNFLRSIISLVKSKPVNARNNRNIEFLVWFLKNCRPVNYKREILNVLRERDEKLADIIVDDNYTCLHLLLDCYMAVVTTDDDAFEHYLFKKNQSIPFYAGYLMQYYLLSEKYFNKVKALFETLLTPGNEERLQWVIIKAEENSYNNVSWRSTFVLLNRGGLLYTDAAESGIKAMIAGFIANAAEKELAQPVENEAALTVESCFLAWMNYRLNKSRQYNPGKLWAVMTQHIPRDGAYTDDQEREVLDDVVNDLEAEWEESRWKT